MAKKIEAGVTQRSFQAPTMYFLYTREIPLNIYAMTLKYITGISL